MGSIVRGVPYYFSANRATGTVIEDTDDPLRGRSLRRHLGTERSMAYAPPLALKRLGNPMPSNDVRDAGAGPPAFPRDIAQ